MTKVLSSHDVSWPNWYSGIFRLNTLFLRMILHSARQCYNILIKFPYKFSATYGIMNNDYNVHSCAMISEIRWEVKECTLMI